MELFCLFWHLPRVRAEHNTRSALAARERIEGSVMSQTEDGAQRNRRSKAVPVLGAAGLSLSLASSAPAAIGG